MAVKFLFIAACMLTVFTVYVASDCGHPGHAKTPSLDKSLVLFTRVYPEGYRMRYENCSEGGEEKGKSFMLGSQYRTCTNGRWTPLIPQCCKMFSYFIHN